MSGKEILPIRFQSLDADKSFETFSKAIDENHTPEEPKAKPDQSKKIAESQSQKIVGYEKSAIENQKKGELIYENYSEVKEILDTLNKARAKHSWKEIKKRLKEHPVIKDIDDKNGKVVIEISSK